MLNRIFKIHLVCVLSAGVFALDTPRGDDTSENLIQFPKVQNAVLDSLVSYKDPQCHGPPTLPTLNPPTYYTSDSFAWNCWNFNKSSTDSIGIRWSEHGIPHGNASIHYRVYEDQYCQGVPIGNSFRSDYPGTGQSYSDALGACVPNSYFANGESFTSVEYFIPTAMRTD